MILIASGKNHNLSHHASRRLVMGTFEKNVQENVATIIHALVLVETNRIMLVGFLEHYGLRMLLPSVLERLLAKGKEQVLILYKYILILA